MRATPSSAPHATRRLSTGAPADVAAEMAHRAQEAAQAARTTPQALVGVGVGSPGSVDKAAGTVSSARNLPGWDGTFALGPELSQKLGHDRRDR